MSITLAKYIKPEHRSAARTLGYVLTLSETNAWLDAALVWRTWLTPSELASLAYAALKAQEPEHALLTVNAALGGLGTPLPPLLSRMREAKFWADTAPLASVKACVLAGYNRMPPKDRSAFLNLVQGEATA